MVFLIFSFLLSVWSKILQVHLITRHCDRTPLSDINFPFNKYNWKNEFNLGDGKLTDLGVHQCYLMGTHLHSRYIKKISPNRIHNIPLHFDPDIYNFHSSYKDRAMRSCYSAAHALFPLGMGQAVVDKNNEHYALPSGITNVFVKPGDMYNDMITRGYMNCMEVEVASENFWNSFDGVELKKKFEKKFQNKICSKLGLHASLDDFDPVFHAIVFFLNNNLFYNVTFSKDEIDWLHDAYEGIERKYYKSVNKNIATSFFFEKLLNDFSGIVHSKSDNKNFSFPKYVHWSAHDTTIGSALSAMNLTNIHPDLNTAPLLGSALSFELHEINGNFSVNIVYLKSWEGGFKEYNIHKSDPSVFSDFKDYIKKCCVVDDWCEICQPMGSDFLVSNYCLRKKYLKIEMNTLSSMIFLFCVIGVLCCVCLLLIICYLFLVGNKKFVTKKKKFNSMKKRYSYTHL